MIFNKKTIRDVDLKGKRVLVRTMLNVPMDNDVVSDDMRLQAAVPTISYLLDQGARIVLISHHSHDGQSLEPVARKLSEILKHPVKFLPDCLGLEAERAVKALKPLDIIVFENLRFHSEEEENNEAFARTLAGYADIFIQDDFTTTHREHASMVGIPKFMPAVSGMAVEREVTTISRALENPKRPVVAVTGGAKVSTKIQILSFLLQKVDVIFVGGAMANTFLVASGKSVGKSLVEIDQIDRTKRIMKEAKESGKKLLLPIDVVVASEIDPPLDVRTVDVSEVGEDDIIADLGPKTIAQLEDVVSSEGTIIWNGPAGIFETNEFASGTEALAHTIIASGAFSLVGGGDTCDFVDNAGLHDKFSFVSTGGGASLELMSGKTLPGVEALLDKEA